MERTNAYNFENAVQQLYSSALNQKYEGDKPQIHGLKDVRRGLHDLVGEHEMWEANVDQYVDTFKSERDGAIEDFYKNSDLTVAEIAEKVGYKSAGSVYARLREMRKEGRNIEKRSERKNVSETEINKSGYLDAVKKFGRAAVFALATTVALGSIPASSFDVEAYQAKERERIAVEGKPYIDNQTGDKYNSKTLVGLLEEMGKPTDIESRKAIFKHFFPDRKYKTNDNKDQNNELYRTLLDQGYPDDLKIPSAKNDTTGDIPLPSSKVTKTSKQKASEYSNIETVVAPEAETVTVVEAEKPQPVRADFEYTELKPAGAVVGATNEVASIDSGKGVVTNPLKTVGRNAGNYLRNAVDAATGIPSLVDAASGNRERKNASTDYIRALFGETEESRMVRHKLSSAFQGQDIDSAFKAYVHNRLSGKPNGSYTSFRQDGSLNDLLDSSALSDLGKGNKDILKDFEEKKHNGDFDDLNADADIQVNHYVLNFSKKDPSKRSKGPIFEQGRLEVYSNNFSSDDVLRIAKAANPNLFATIDSATVSLSEMEKAFDVNMMQGIGNGLVGLVKGAVTFGHTGKGATGHPDEYKVEEDKNGDGIAVQMLGAFRHNLTNPFTVNTPKDNNGLNPYTEHRQGVENAMRAAGGVLGRTARTLAIEEAINKSTKNKGKGSKSGGNPGDTEGGVAYASKYKYASDGFNLAKRAGFDWARKARFGW